MSNEEKIIELTERIEKLEKAENKRIIKSKIKTIYEIVKIVLIVSIFIYGYVYINNTVIKPYKEKVDYINNKIDTVENFVEDKFDSFKNLFN